MVSVGSPAPAFTLPDQDGQPVTLEELKGQWVVLWWYPKALTPGCTKQGQGFRDLSDQFAAQNAVILGASFDTPEDNRRFAEAEGFPYRLLGDTSREVGARYGVRKDPDEERADFSRRITYLIDPQGIVRQVYAVTDVAKNPQDVLDDIADLSS